MYFLCFLVLFDNDLDLCFQYLTIPQLHCFFVNVKLLDDMSKGILEYVDSLEYVYTI